MLELKPTNSIGQAIELRPDQGYYGIRRLQQPLETWLSLRSTDQGKANVRLQGRDNSV